MRTIVVSRFRGRIFVQSYAISTAGVCIATEFIETMPSDISPNELAVSARRMFSHSISGVPHPTDFKKVAEPLLKVAGVKSWATFGNNSDSCSVSEIDGSYEIIPERKFKRQGAKTGVVESKRILNNPLDDELGQAIQTALKVSAEAEPQY